MIKIHKLLWLLLILFIASGIGYSQNKKGNLPLKEVLKKIERQHKVQFNYIEEEVSVIQLAPPIPVLSLTEKLDYLKVKTNLDFEIIDSKYIVISSKKQSKKTVAVKEDSIISLNEIQIERYLATGMSKNSDGTFTVRPKKFGILPGLIEPDVLQTMQQIPGIYSTDQTISNINVRSGTHDQNLFIWNGIRMFQTGHFFGLISAFNPLLAQKISISKNGTSAFYGENISSVIDISSLSNGIENSSSNVSANLISIDFNTKIKTSEKSSLQVSGRRSFTDLASSPTYHSYFNRVFQNTIVTSIERNENINYKTDEDFYFYDFTGQYQQKIASGTELVVDVIGISNTLKLDQSTSSYSSLISRNSSLDQHNFGGNIAIKTDWNENNASRINAYASYYNLDATNESIENDQVLYQQNMILDIGYRLENKHVLNSNLTFNNGYQYNEIGIRNAEKINNPSFSRKIKDVLRSHALILETELQDDNKKAYLKTGIRTNYLEKFNLFIFEPRIQFNYNLSNQFSLEILGEKKSQTSSQIIDLQQDFLGIEKRRWTLTDNDSIPIQKSNQISLGLTFRNKDWLVTLDNYYKQVSGISSTSQAFQNQLEFVKINGDYKVLGTEILFQRNFKNFYSWLSYCWSNSEYSFDENIPAEFASNFQIVHSVACAAVYEFHKIKVALGSKWHSGRPETTPYSNVLNFDDLSDPKINYNNPNNENISDYFEVNLSAAYDWELNPNTKLQLGLSVMNILNKQNVVNRYYRVNKTDESIESVNTYGLERTPNISVKLSF